MVRSVLPRLVLALLAALGLTGQGAMSLAHAVAHRAESDAALHAGGDHHSRGGAKSSLAEVEGVHHDSDHSTLHAVVGVGPVTTVPVFVGTATVAVPGSSLILVPMPPVAFAVLARPPGLSAPPTASRAPPIG